MLTKFDTLYIQFWDTKWTSLFAQNQTNKKSRTPQLPSEASEAYFKKLKKHRVFNGFWLHRPAKKT